MDLTDHDKLRQAVKEVEFLMHNPSAALPASTRQATPPPPEVANRSSASTYQDGSLSQPAIPLTNTQAPRVADQDINFGPVLRDVAIVWVLSLLGGFVAGAGAGAGGNKEGLTVALAISNIVFGTVGFAIAGYLAPSDRDRWRHLGFVALGTWITGLINVAFFNVTLPMWLGGAVVMVIIMGIGGGISFLLKPAVTSPVAPSAPAIHAQSATQNTGYYYAPPPLARLPESYIPEAGQAERRLKELKRLQEQGLITSAEFAAKRQEIIAHLQASRRITRAALSTSECANSKCLSVVCGLGHPKGWTPNLPDQPKRTTGVDVRGRVD